MTLTASTLITSIQFEDRIVWSVADGVDIANFAVNGFLRNVLKGQTCGKGLDIIVTGTVPGAGDLKVLITGEKPA